ncbi:baseplate J/gp47 family protein [Roseobacter sp.]|uniref:baseplate J/gp47 family protein n=1 Tax=Roseobacter sp. TaxID=1907202 RepID=UPI00385BD601
MTLLPIPRLDVLNNWKNIAVTPGASAHSRLPQPLENRQVRLRSLSVAEAFCHAGEHLGAQDAFLRNAADVGPWARLFLSEPAYLLAEVISFNADDAALKFEIAIEEDPDKAIQQIGDLSRRLKDWLERIEASHQALFSKQIAQINAEADLLKRLKGLSRNKTKDILAAVKTWGVSARALSGDRDALQKARAIETGLRGNHALLRNTVASLQPIAQRGFDARIASGDMDPALGLLIAELRTAMRVETQIDEFLDRFTQFYYRDVIGQVPAGPSQERVLLHLPQIRKSSVLEKGTSLQARTETGTIQNFETAATVPISQSKVARTAVLSYDTDPMISLNATLGGITGVRAAAYSPGDRNKMEPVFCPNADDAVRLGLDISSPIFLMAEGERWIEVSINMERRSAMPALSTQRVGHTLTDTGSEPLDPDLVLALREDSDLVRAFSETDLETGIEVIARRVQALAAERRVTLSLSLVYEVLAHHALGVEPLRVLLGRIVTLSLIETRSFPKGDYWTALQAKIDVCRTELSGQSAFTEAATDQQSMIFDAFETAEDGSFVLAPEDVFEKLLSDAFAVTLSTADGPVSATVMQVLSNVQTGNAGLTLKLKLNDTVPAITGPEPGAAPVLSVRYAANARICPVSFFERYQIRNFDIRVKAVGLKQLIAFSDDGPVVTDQAFMPFGARAKEGASVWVGCAEMALKPVTDVGVKVTWADTPNPAGGFKGHYEHYANTKEVPDPKLSLAFLSGDGWKALGTGDVPMFERSELGDLSAEWSFESALYAPSNPANRSLTPQDFSARQKIPAGMVSLTLSGTANGFLADEYPLALVKAMRPRLLPQRIAASRPVPPAPFVPRIAKISLSYTAHAKIEINVPQTARKGEKVVQVGPFGQVEVFPKRTLRRTTLFPARLGYGHLFIQIAGSDATGPLTLLFNVADRGHLRLVPPPNPIAWYYLTDKGWSPLPATAVSSDSTAGLMRSGLVGINLPEDAISTTSEMPDSGAWLAAVATKPDLSAFPCVISIVTNGVWAQRSDTSFDPAASSRIWTFAPPIAGVGAPIEVPVAADVRGPETTQEFTARVGERLRHRKRSVTPWDIERLVLDAFPEVWMVKCLPHLDRNRPHPAPGCVTVVVVCKPPVFATDAPATPQVFDVGTLERIREHLTRLGPEFAQYDVVNPSFETLHVRANLVFGDDRDDGALAQRLKTHLNRYLSVWTASDPLNRFGWSLNVKLLRAHINALDYVRRVNDFSVLHLASDDAGTHVLLDTAQSDTRGPHGPWITAAQPWSLPLSASDHALTPLLTQNDDRPTQSGIGRLAIGDMLIVGQGTHS